MKGSVRQKNIARKRRVVERIYEMKYSLKGYKDRNRHPKKKEKKKKGVGKLGWFMSETKTATSPPREGQSAGTDETASDTFTDVMRNMISLSTTTVSQVKVYQQMKNKQK